jgi:hypothetical protein
MEKCVTTWRGRIGEASYLLVLGSNPVMTTNLGVGGLSVNASSKYDHTGLWWAKIFSRLSDAIMVVRIVNFHKRIVVRIARKFQI